MALRISTLTLGAQMTGLAMLLLLPSACPTKADGTTSWGRPATESLGIQRTFERLVDIEARHLACANKTVASAPYGNLEERMATQSAFAACAKGPPEYSCSAPLIAVQTAQIFFDAYYGERLSYPTARMDVWLQNCGRPRKAEDFQLDKIDIAALCRTSYLGLPVWYRRHISSTKPLNWSFAIQGDPGQICGPLPPRFMDHYERRCTGIFRMGAAEKGHRENYEDIPLVHDYYDEVDWDVCRVLAVGDMTVNLANFRKSDAP